MSTGLKGHPQKHFKECTFIPYLHLSTYNEGILRAQIWKHNPPKHLDFLGNSHLLVCILYLCLLLSSGICCIFPMYLLSLPTHPLLLCSFQACNTKYPDYDKTGSICVSEHINNTLTRYRWLISAPAGPDGVTSPMREVDFDTFFTSSKMITLDSIYFHAGSRVQCAARAVNSNGDEGLELSSPIVTISKEEGMGRTKRVCI